MPTTHQHRTREEMIATLVRYNDSFTSGQLAYADALNSKGQAVAAIAIVAASFCASGVPVPVVP